jgi:predicted DNA-binding transcriptional regulator YafY
VGSATIDRIAQAISVPRRTLQRRLAALVASGTLRAVASGKQRRYKLAANRAAGPGELPVS